MCSSPSSAPVRVLRGPSFRCLLPFVTFVSFCSNSVLPASSVRAAEIDFERQVAPILTANCLKCHNSTKARAGLNLSSRENALKGSDAGEVLVPGKPEKSLLLKRAEDGSMPPETDGRRLTAEEVAVLTAWVKAGAKWPEGRVLSAPTASAAASSTVSPPHVARGARRLRVQRIRRHIHSHRNLSPAIERGPRAVRTRIDRGARSASVPQVGKGPAAAAARQAEGNKRQGGDGNDLSHGSSPVSPKMRGRVGPS